MKHTIFTASIMALGIAGVAHADSFQNFSEAAGDSAEASARIVASGGQVAMGAVAIPLAAIGGLTEASGEAATAISDDLWQAANAPLTVDDDVVMAQPAPSVPHSPSSTTNPAEE